MTLLSNVTFEDVKESPLLRMRLPMPIHIGSRVRLDMKVARKKEGRYEELTLLGDFQVSAVSYSFKRGLAQNVTLATMGASPSWRAVKKPQAKRMAPAINPKTIVE